MTYSKKEIISNIKSGPYADLFKQGNFLLTQKITQLLFRKGQYTSNSQKLYSFINDHNLFENILLNYVKGRKAFTLHIDNHPLTNTILGCELGYNESKNNIISQIKLSNGTFLNITVNSSEKFIHTEYLTKEFGKETGELIGLFISHAGLKYDENEREAIGSALSELVLVLQEIESDYSSDNE